MYHIRVCFIYFQYVEAVPTGMEEEEAYSAKESVKVILIYITYCCFFFSTFLKQVLVGRMSEMF